MNTKLRWLNFPSQTASLQMEVVKSLPSLFKGKLTLLEIGTPYGGAVEWMARELPNSTVYGFDTFEGHPRDLSYDPNSPEAICMEPWYAKFGKQELEYDYQRKILDEEGLKNAILVKGRVNEHSFDMIDKIHFAMLDLDLINPTRTAYEAIKNKIVKGGFLFMHDYSTLNLICDFITQEVIPSGLWQVESTDNNLAVLRKI
jgi:hypothetical protein